MLTKAFTYVRPVLEYCTSVWSPHTQCSINKIESCQRWFTKRIYGLSGMQYSERLASLGLDSIQVRRLKCDLTMCYKIIHSNAVIHSQDFVIYSDYLGTRVHQYKLFKRYSNVNAYKNSFINRICDIWNTLPDTVVEASIGQH